MKRERRDPSETANVAIPGITAAKPRRDRSWDRAHTSEVATYRLTAELKQTVKDLSDRLNVSPGELVRYLLEYGLDAYNGGRLKLEPKPGKHTLYPK